jgi:hypothetical protein
MATKRRGPIRYAVVKRPSSHQKITRPGVKKPELVKVQSASAD